MYKSVYLMEVLRFFSISLHGSYFTAQPVAVRKKVEKIRENSDILIFRR